LPPEIKNKKGKKKRPGEKLRPDLKKIQVDRSPPVKNLMFFYQFDRRIQPDAMDEKENPREYSQNQDEISKNKFFAHQYFPLPVLDEKDCNNDKGEKHPKRPFRQYSQPHKKECRPTIKISSLS
jgi:hypothetical protein